MLYELLTPLADEHGFFNLFNYITFRAGAALVTAFAISVLIGRPMIDWLRAKQGKGQPIRDLSLEAQLSKKGTPTMGGFIIWAGLFISTLLWAQLRNPYIWVVLALTASFAFVGFLDDIAKVRKQTADGVSGKVRLLIEFLVAGAACAFIMGIHGGHTPLGHADWGPLNPLAQWIAQFAPTTSLEPTLQSFSGGVAIPFVNNYYLPLGGLFIVFGMVVIVGWANAVNFTDGLDGLAIVPTMFAASAYAMIAYLVGNFIFARYLGIAFTPGAGELAVLLAALVGGGMGFLWYNTYPATVFMGDTGSLGLGGLLGVVAVAIKHEFALVVIGGVFILELVSVMLQVSWFKITRKMTGEGKRLFKMAPLHHHFQKSGWPETRVTVRFWIMSMMFALAGLATLKLR